MSDQYYLQCGFSGNDMLFWRYRKAGYTTNLDEAHVFTKAEAYEQHARRSIDVPREVSEMKRIAHLAVALQDLPPDATPNANWEEKIPITPPSEQKRE